MDYLYINAIVKETYLDLPCGCEFPEAYRKNLHKYVINDETLKNPEIDNAITYFSIKEKDRAPLLILANVEKQKNCASVGQAIQCLGWEWDAHLIEHNMDKVFRSGFYSENEMDAMVAAQKTFPLPKQARSDAEIINIELKSEIKKAILTAVFIRWLRHEEPLRIAVPKNVDYSSYVWAAIEKIYALFPIALRLEAGFSSYMPNLEKAVGRVYLGFIPEEMADAKTLFLDGSRRSAITALEKGTNRKQLDQFIDFLSNADEAGCKDLIEEIYEDLEGSGNPQKLLAVTPRDYQPFGEATSLLTADGSLESLLPLWNAFLHEQEKQSVRMRNRVAGTIRSRIVPEEFCEILHNFCANKKTPQAILQVIGSYKPFYNDNLPLTDAVWTLLLTLLQETDASKKVIYDEISASATALAQVLTPERLDELFRSAALEQLSQIKSQTAETKSDTARISTQAKHLLSQICERQESIYASELQAAVEEHLSVLAEQQSAFVYAEVKAHFDALRLEPALKPAQINKIIKEANNMLMLIEQEKATNELTELSNTIGSYIDRLKEKANSSSAKYSQILDILKSPKNYFAILEDLQVQDRTTLDPEQIADIGNYLRKIRPVSIVQYKDSFENFYHKRLMLSAISSLSDYVCRIVVQDICEFNRLCIPYSCEKTTKENIDQISGAVHTAKRISDSCAVEIQFHDMTWDGKWFTRMLSLTHTEQTMGKKSDFERVFYALIACGAYSGAELPRCAKMLADCGLEPMKLFVHIIAGRITDCNEQQYIDAFSAILKYSSKKRKEALNVMNSKCAEVKHKNKAAYNAYREFKTTAKKGKSRSQKSLLPAFIGVAAIALVLVVAVAVLVMTGTLQLASQSLSAEYPAVHYLMEEEADTVEQLFGEQSAADFSAYRTAVTECLSNAPQPTQDEIIKAYTKGLDSTVPIDKNTQVDWNTYFFWVCWTYSQDTPNNAAASFAIKTYHEEACAILRVLTSVLPEPESADPAAEVVENTAPAAKATQGDIGSIISAISDAATEGYASAQANAYEIKLILALFGSKRDKGFDSHQDLVNQTLRAPDASVKALLNGYQILPDDTEILFLENGTSVTISEYAFWAYWASATYSKELTEAANPVAELHTWVVTALRLIHSLPDVEASFLDATVTLSGADTEVPDEITDTSDATDATDAADTKDEPDATDAADTKDEPDATDAADTKDEPDATEVPAETTPEDADTAA